jgi:cytochrome P450
MTTVSALEEIFDPLGEHFEDPYPIYAHAREHAPIFYSRRFDAWVVTRYDDIRTALRRPEVFASTNALRPLSPVGPAAMEVLMRCHPVAQSSITTDGEIQRPFRSLLNAALSPRRVAALEPLLRHRADELIDGIVGDGHADLISRFAYPLPLETIARIAGLDPEARRPGAGRCRASAAGLPAGAARTPRTAADRAARRRTRRHRRRARSR